VVLTVVVGVNVPVHVAVAPPEPLGVHAVGTLPLVPVLVNVTALVPPGVIGVPLSVSVTVTVHVVATPTWTDEGEHESDVDVKRLTLTVVAPLLTACVLSPP
jgi:hypothetical protein